MQFVQLLHYNRLCLVSVYIGNCGRVRDGCLSLNTTRVQLLLWIERFIHMILCQCCTLTMEPYWEESSSFLLRYGQFMSARVFHS